MRAAKAALIAMFVAACGGGAGASLVPTPPPATPTAAPATPTLEPTEAASPTAAPATAYTTDDVQIAELVRTISAEATAELLALGDMSLDAQLPALMPVPAWVNERKAEVDALTPSTCTQEAVLLFHRGIDRYSDVAEKFLAWREWGVIGDPYPANMPLQAVAFLEDALESLGAHCPT